jgi:hypothetical protein
MEKFPAYHPYIRENFPPIASTPLILLSRQKTAGISPTPGGLFIHPELPSGTSSHPPALHI